MVPSTQGPVSIKLKKIPFESQLLVLRTVCEEASEGQTWGDTMGRSHFTIRIFTFSSGKLHEGQKRRLNKSLPPPPRQPLILWENEAPCRFHSTLGQTRNHSPECKPPILQDVGNLEQETAVTHTLTSLSLTPCSLGWGTERLQNMETVLPPQVCTKPYTPDDHRSGEGILHFNIFARNPFFFIESVTYTQH